MSDYDYVDKGNSDGTILGQASTAKVGFWGVTPCDQAAAPTTGLTVITYTTASTLLTTLSAAATGGAGFLITDEAQSFLQVVKNIQVRIGELSAALSECGLIAGGTATATSDTQYDFVGAGADDGIILGQASTATVGFWGITPCDQPAALTAQGTTITITATVAELDYTVATLVSGSTKYNFADDVWPSLFYVCANMQTRIAEIQSRLAEAGVLAGGTAVTSTAAGSAIYDYLDHGNDDGVILGKLSTSKVGFWATTPVDQPAALTAAATTITCTAPGTADYAIADVLVTSSALGFVTLTAAQTVLYVVQNAQTRLAEMEARLEEVGLVAAN